MREFLPYSANKSTWSSYATAGRSFGSFVRTRGKRFTYPVCQEDLARYIIYQHKIRGLSPDTIRNYVSHLKQLQILNDHSGDVFDSEYTTRLLTSITNLHKVKLEAPALERMAMTIHDVRVFGHALATQVPELGFTDKQVIWVCVLLSFWGSLRLGSIIPGCHGIDDIRLMKWSNLKYPDSNHVTLFIPLPKHLKKEKGYVRDYFTLCDEKAICPVDNIFKLHNKRFVNRDFVPEEHVLIFDNGSHLTMDYLNTLLNRLLTPLISGRIYCHSMRAGLPSLMASHPDEFNEEELMDTGDWHSSSLRKYTRSQGIGRKKTFHKLKPLFRRK